MSSNSDLTQKNIVADLIKKRIIEKIETLFKSNNQSTEKHFDKNLAKLNSIINKENNSDFNIEAFKLKMIKVINQLDLSSIISGQTGYQDGVKACIQALQEIGVAINQWNFGTKNIQEVLIEAEKKLTADLNRISKDEQNKIIEQLIDNTIVYKDIPQNFKENDEFIINLLETEAKLKSKGMSENELENYEPAFIHPYHFINDNLSSRSEKAQKLIFKLIDNMPTVSMRNLVKPTSSWKSMLKEHKIIINEAVFFFTVQRDPGALEFIPKEYLRNEKILEAALKRDSSQLKFVPEDLRQEMINKIGAENLLKNNVLAYKYFPYNEANTKQINSFLSNIENIIVNPSIADAEMRDVAIVYGNKNNRQDKTATVGLNYSGLAKESQSKQIATDLNELIQHVKRINPQKNINLALAAHSNTSSEKPGVGYIFLEDIAKVCKKNSEIKKVDLLTCSAAGNQIVSEAEQKMTSELKNENTIQKKYLFTKKLPNQSEESMAQHCRTLCKENGAEGVYFLIENKKATPKYSLQSMKLIHDDLIIKTMPIPANKEMYIERFEVKYNEKVKKNQGVLIPLSFNELIELRSTTKKQHRFDPDHPKFAEDKKRFPFLAKFEIKERDLKESKMKSLVEALKIEHVNREISIQAYHDFMEVDADAKYLRAVKGHTFHLDGYKKSFKESDQPIVDRVKVLDQQQDKITTMLSGENTSSMAKKIKVTLNANVEPVIYTKQEISKSPIIDKSHSENNPENIFAENNQHIKTKDVEDNLQPEQHEEDAEKKPEQSSEFQNQVSAMNSSIQPQEIATFNSKEVQLNFKDKLKELKILHNQEISPELITLKENLREQINNLKLKSTQLSQESSDKYYFNEGGVTALQKADIINKFLDKLDLATTCEQYSQIINDFTTKLEFEHLKQARGVVYKALSLNGDSGSLVEDLQKSVKEYINYSSCLTCK